jgi:hypothetical protein
VEGWDRDPLAVWSCRATLVEWALDNGAQAELRVVEVDALSTTGRPAALTARERPYEAGVGAVVTNPPYLEAKRMTRIDKASRLRLPKRFSALTGAWDLYLAFCALALEQVGEGGAAVLLLPNKVLQGRYASRFRAAVQADVGWQLAGLVDLSSMKPRPFPGTGVYPVVLHLQRRPDEVPLRVARVQTAADLDRTPELVDSHSLGRVGGESPWFVPRSTWPHLAPLFGDVRLGDVARLVSTCSFHKRGLREQFVTTERPDELAHPYLGGPSRARRTEVDLFTTRWAGWWIRYDQETLRREHRNGLPDLGRTFQRPKVIWCQHGRRMRVVMDPEGHFVTKDVYPVGWPIAAGWTLEALVAVLASTVFSALYNTVFQGIVCGGETFHYLPAFLNTIPVPPVERLAGCVELVRELHGPHPDAGAWLRLDRLVATAYGIEEGPRQHLVAEHLTRVGAQAPQLRHRD